MRIEDYIVGTLHDEGMGRHQADLLGFSFLEDNEDLRTSEKEDQIDINRLLALSTFPTHQHHRSPRRWRCLD